MSLFIRPGSKCYWTRFYFEGKRVQQSTKCSNKKDAEKFEAALRTELNFGRINLDAPGKVEEKPVPTFPEAVEGFLAWSKENQKESTYRRYLTGSKALLRHFGTVTVDAITRNDVEKFVADRKVSKKKAPIRKLKKDPNAKTKKPIRPATINRELALLRIVFNRLIDDQTVAINPTRGFKFLAENNQQDRVLTEQEFRLYLVAASQPLRDIAVIMYELGMRPSEVVALRKENIDWQANKLRIFDGKTKAARRSLEMPETVARIIADRYDKTENGLLFGGGRKGISDSPIIKVTNAHRAAIRRVNETIKAENEKRQEQKPELRTFRLYDLRHTFASHYVNSGGDLVTLAAILGHSNLDMVYRYAHATEQHQKLSLRNLDNYRKGVTNIVELRRTA